MVNPSVVVNTTSPVEIAPRRHNCTGQTRTPAVTANTVTACSNLNRSNERKLARRACILSAMYRIRRCCSRRAAPKERTRLMLLTTSVRSPLTRAA